LITIFEIHLTMLHDGENNIGGGAVRLPSELAVLQKEAECWKGVDKAEMDATSLALEVEVEEMAKLMANGEAKARRKAEERDAEAAARPENVLADIWKRAAKGGYYCGKYHRAAQLAAKGGPIKWELLVAILRMAYVALPEHLEAIKNYFRWGR
jgi:hypothetical protein